MPCITPLQTHTHSLSLFFFFACFLSQFLELPQHDSLTKQLPRDDHLRHFYNEGGEDLVSCIVKHVPALDCAFRDKLGKYYDTYNKRLYQWMNDTKPDANVNEIKFLPFEDWSTTVPCVPDARALFNDVLAGMNPSYYSPLLWLLLCLSTYCTATVLSLYTSTSVPSSPSYNMRLLYSLVMFLPLISTPISLSSPLRS